jgi:hypothetical protein
MKKQTKPTVIKLSERFDKQLLSLLSQELQSLRTTKNHIIKTLSPKPDGGLQVA